TTRQCVHNSLLAVFFPGSSLVTRDHQTFPRVHISPAISIIGIPLHPPGTHRSTETVSYLTHQILVVLIILAAYTHVSTPPRCAPRRPPPATMLTLSSSSALMSRLLRAALLAGYRPDLVSHNATHALG